MNSTFENITSSIGRILTEDDGGWTTSVAGLIIYYIISLIIIGISLIFINSKL